jgi:hypothetical protein
MEKLLQVLKLLPAIISAIKAIEEAVPGNGLGEQKLAALRGVLEAADSTIANLWPTIENVVKVLVNLFNTTKTFNQ